MPLSAPYMAAIRGFEGYTPKAKWDAKQFSNGYGTKAQYDGEEIDEATAQQRYNSELTNAAGYVDKAFPGLPEGRRAALTSLTYNAGPGWIDAGLGDAMRRGDYNDAAARFTQYDKSEGKYNEGLAKRRAQEVAWWDGNEAPIGMAFKEQGKENMTPMQLAMLQGQGGNPMQQPQPQEQEPSLGSKFIAGGPGALFGAPNGVFQNADGTPGYNLGGALQGAGAWAMANDHPEALGLLKKTAGEGAFSMTQDPNTGQTLVINRHTGQVSTRNTPGFDPQRKVKEAADIENAKQVNKLNESMPAEAMKSSAVLGQLDQLKQYLSDPNVYQGTGGERVADLKKLGAAFGIDVQGNANTDAARSLSNQLALTLRNPANGAGMPGAMSDADRDYLKKIIASVDNTPEGNVKIIDAMQKIHQRNLDVEKLRQDYVTQNGRLDMNFHKVVSDMSQKNPLFTAQPTTPAAAQPAAGGGGYKVLKVH